MPALRVATAGAALVLLTAGSTVAQPTAPATGKPISLLKILSLPDKTKITAQPQARHPDLEDSRCRHAAKAVAFGCGRNSRYDPGRCLARRGADRDSATRGR
jgi:hypothetical protein